MEDFRRQIARGELKVSGKIIVGGKRIRNDDATRFTVPPALKRKTARRKANRRARKARRASR